MKADEYIAAVRARLPDFPAEEAEGIDQCILQLYRSGFTVKDAAAYCRCMEEVNPSLDEDVALKRMSYIRSKYDTEPTVDISEYETERP